MNIIVVLAFVAITINAVFAIDHGVTRSALSLTRPVPLFEIADQDDAAFIEEGAKPFKTCGRKMACPLKNGVCCPDKRTCCAERCTEEGCGLSPEHQALAVAKMMLTMEAKVQVSREQKSKSQSEAGRKRHRQMEDQSKKERERDEKKQKEEELRRKAADLKAQAELKKSLGLSIVQSKDSRRADKPKQ